MNHAVNCLVGIVDHERNKKHDSIASHDIRIFIVHHDIYWLIVAAGDLGDGLRNISEVSGG